MNVFYCCCIHDPWVEVASQLKDKGFNPAYWIGWAEGESTVKNQLNPSVYHDINLAWKGLFPKEIGDKPFPIEIDGLELRKYAYEEAIGMRMMERLDRDRESFTFKERQYFFRRLLNDWLFVLKNQKIDLIIFPSIPHRVFDYVIYTAAKILNIDFLSFKKTRWQGELIPLHSTIEEIPDLTQKESSKKIPKVTEYINNIRLKEYKDTEPDYMIAQKKDAEKKFHEKIVEKVKNQPQKVTQIFAPFPNGWKKRGVSIEDSSYTRAEVYLQEYKGNKYKEKLKNYYESKCSNLDLDQPFILVAFHYQPEVNSVPEGNIYGDQLLVVKALLKHTPENVLLYVKEHSSQFMPKLEGETGRTKELYDQLIQYDRVKLVSTSVDPFSLVDKARGVASLIGNICLEAIIRGKPAIVFGNAWFENVHGVLKVDSADKMLQIESHLENFKPNPTILDQQIHNTVSQCLRANHYKFVAQKSDVSDSESIENLVEYINSYYLK